MRGRAFQIVEDELELVFLYLVKTSYDHNSPCGHHREQVGIVDRVGRRHLSGDAGVADEVASDRYNGGIEFSGGGIDGTKQQGDGLLEGGVLVAAEEGERVDRGLRDTAATFGEGER